MVKTLGMAIVAVVIVAIVLVVFLVPVSSEKIDVQCVTAPCPPIIVEKTIYEIILTERPNEPEPIACTLEHAPVCGVDGNTYSNACFANAENVQIAHNGECTEDEGIIMTDEPSTFCRIYPTATGC